MSWYPHVRFTARVRALCAVLLLTLVAAGCGGDDPTQPTREQIAGTWNAVLFRSTTGTAVENHIEHGSSISLVLNADATTSGRLLVRNAQGEVEMDESLAGTWTLQGHTVALQHQADTFLRDMPFTIQWPNLVGDRTFGGTRVQVTFARQ